MHRRGISRNAAPAFPPLQPPYPPTPPHPHGRPNPRLDPLPTPSPALRSQWAGEATARATHVMFGFTEGQDLRVSAGYRAQFNQRGITKKVCGVAPAFKLGEVCGWRLLQGCKKSVGVGWAQFNQRGVTKKV